MNDNGNFGSEQPDMYAIWEFHYGRGVLAKTFGEYEKAFEEFQKAGQAVGTLPEVQAKVCLSMTAVALAHTHMLLGRYLLAIPLLEDAVILRAGNTPRRSAWHVEIFEYFGRCFRGLYQFEKAELAFKDAMEIAESLGGAASDKSSALCQLRNDNNADWRAWRNRLQK